MLTQAVHIVIITLSSLFAIILLSQRNNKANIFLSFFLLVIAFQFFLIIIINVELLSSSWIKYNTIFGYVYGPSIYCYIVYLIDSNQKLFLKCTIHYIPSFLAFLGLLFISDSTLFFALLMYASLVFYTFFSFKLINAFKRKLKVGRWKKPNTTLQWLQYFLILFTMLLFLDFIDQTIFYLYSFEGVSIVHFGLVILISWMFFKAFNQPDLFKGHATILIKTKGHDWELRDNVKKNGPGVLSLKASIESNLFEKQWYLIPNLSLEELAKKLDTTPQMLSTTINTHYGLNFSSFINSLRIEHAKEMLKGFTKSEKSISEIMFDCGFSSKSSFNTIFRNETGVTPSQFRELEQ